MRAGRAPAKAQRPDWEVIEREYRSGQLSIRQIARQHGINDKSVRQRAEKNGWARDLADAVRQKIQSALVRSAVPAGLPLTDESIVDYAAARGVEVIRQHREHLGRIQRITTQLAQALEVMLSGGKPGGKPGVPFLGLKESPSDVLVKIAQATARWMPLEREAFGLDQRHDDPKKPAPPGVDWRTLFEQAGIGMPADGGSCPATAASPLCGGVTALPSGR